MPVVMCWVEVHTGYGLRYMAFSVDFVTGTEIEASGVRECMVLGATSEGSGARAW